MQHLIICEGKVDALLLSYLLIKLDGWRHKSASRPLELNSENQVSNLYVKGVYEIHIFGAGGKENIPIKLKEAVEKSKFAPNDNDRFDKVALLFDSDADPNPNVRSWCIGAGLTVPGELAINCADTVKFQYQLNSTPPRNFDFHFFSLSLPPGVHGCLENFLLTELSVESEDDRSIFEKTGALINGLQHIAPLTSARMRPKAQLGCVLSIKSPDWVFSELDRRLREVAWERLPGIKDTFQKLIDFLK